MQTRGSRRTRRAARAVAACTVLAAAVGVTVGTGGATASAEPASATFTKAGTVQTWTVPPRVTSVHVHAEGGAGSRGRNVDFVGVGTYIGGGAGIGGGVDADLSVTPGQVLRVIVGGRGTSSGPGAGLANGGLAGRDNQDGVLGVIGKGNGGAASGVTDAAGAVLVAAGGGGGGGGAGSNHGGDGGAGGGSRGFFGAGGLGGAGGVGSSGANSGGAGDDGVDSGGGGGGGGGGWSPDGTGGGAAGRAGKRAPFAGGPGGGGAGGRSYAVDPKATFSLGQPEADGKVVLSWNQTRLLSATLTSSLNPARVGEQVFLSVSMVDQTFVGTVTFGTYDPATGMETPMVVRDLSKVAQAIWYPQFPVGLTYVWASFSGNADFAPWKSEYLLQVTAEPFKTSISVTPSTLDFGSVPVGSTTTRSVSVFNDGNTPWTLGSLALSDPAFRITGGTCGTAALAPTFSCTYEIGFTPTAPGPTGGSLTLTEAGGSVTTIGFTGSATQVTPPPPQPPTTTTTTEPTTTTTAKPTTTTTTTARPTTTTTTKPAAPKPTVTGVSPASGPRRGGTRVTITGTNLTGATRIRFGERDATDVRCTSSTSCTVTSPRGEDRVHIRVTTPAGTSGTGDRDRFTYTGR